MCLLGLLLPLLLPSITPPLQIQLEKNHIQVQCQQRGFGGFRGCYWETASTSPAYFYFLFEPKQPSKGYPFSLLQENREWGLVYSQEAENRHHRFSKPEPGTYLLGCWVGHPRGCLIVDVQGQSHGRSTIYTPYYLVIDIR